MKLVLRDITAPGSNSVVWDTRCHPMQAEIVDTKGVAVCSHSTSAAPTSPPTSPPTPPPTTVLPTPLPPPATEDCVCIFDVDRTLTGKQGDVTTCQQNKIENIWDTAYGGGWLTLSEAAQKLPETFCNACYLGIVSAGDAGGAASRERPYLLDNVLISEKFTALRQQNGQA